MRYRVIVHCEQQLCTVVEAEPGHLKDASLLKDALRELALQQADAGEACFESTFGDVEFYEIGDEKEGDHGCDLPQHFDDLLEDSSLGTAMAKKNQAETPPDVYRRIWGTDARPAAEIRAERDKCADLVNAGTSLSAEILWQVLGWVLREHDDAPFDGFVKDNR